MVWGQAQPRVIGAFVHAPVFWLLLSPEGSGLLGASFSVAVLIMAQGYCQLLLRAVPLKPSIG